MGMAVRDEVLCARYQWNNEKVVHTAVKFVGFFVQGLPHLGTKTWVGISSDLADIMDRRVPKPANMKAEGFDLLFFGPRFNTFDLRQSESLPKQDITDGPLLFEYPPQFILLDRSARCLTPRRRSMYYDIAEQITEEARETYKLHVVKDFGVSFFTFPPEVYADSANVHRIPILN